MPWEQTEEFIRSGHRDPSEFQEDSLRTITLSEEEGIKAIIGKPKGKNIMEIQSYLFDKDKWNLEKAKAWFEQHEAKTKESFSWAGSIKELHGVSNLIRGKALHPIRTVHPEEWPEVRLYLEDELQKSAASLAGKPLILDHYQPLRGEVLGAEYEDGAIEYIAKIDDPKILDKIRRGKIRHCSVEFEWKSLENVDGVAPRGLNFTGLSLLEAFEPGDPLTTVELNVWEAIIKELKEAKDIEDDVQYAQAVPTANINNLIKDIQRLTERMEALETAREHKPAIEQQREKDDSEDQSERLRREAEERAKKHGIGVKESGNLTKPKEYEYLDIDQFADPVNYRYPIDEKHVHGALTYFNQPDNQQAGEYTHEEAVKIMTKIINAALTHGIEVSYQSENSVYRDLPEDLKTKLVGYKKKESQELKKKSQNEAIIAPETPEQPELSDMISKREILTIIPDERVWRSWSYGPQLLVRKLKRKLELGE